MESDADGGLRRPLRRPRHSWTLSPGAGSGPVCGAVETTWHSDCSTESHAAVTKLEYPIEPCQPRPRERVKGALEPSATSGRRAGAAPR
jgi:hypothetical protein